MSGYGTSEFADTLATGGVQGRILLVDTDGAVIANVSGTTNLVDRQLITITPITGDIFWGYENTVTTTTGSPLCEGQTLAIAAGECADLYIITNSLTPIDVRITEAG